VKNTLFVNANDILFKLYFKVKDLAKREEGQDLVEYGLVVGLICLGAVASMTTIGSQVSTIFSKIASDMTAAAAKG
jgi:pilus assembly protein Flp/PilA